MAAAVAGAFEGRFAATPPTSPDTGGFLLSRGVDPERPSNELRRVRMRVLGSSCHCEAPLSDGVLQRGLLDFLIEDADDEPAVGRNDRFQEVGQEVRPPRLRNLTEAFARAGFRPRPLRDGRTP